MDGHVSTILDELEWAVERADRERAAAEQHERAAGSALETARAGNVLPCAGGPS